MLLSAARSAGWGAVRLPVPLLGQGLSRLRGQGHVCRRGRGTTGVVTFAGTGITRLSGDETSFSRKSILLYHDARLSRHAGRPGIETLHPEADESPWTFPGVLVGIRRAVVRLQFGTGRVVLLYAHPNQVLLGGAPPPCRRPARAIDTERYEGIGYGGYQQTSECPLLRCNTT